MSQALRRALERTWWQPDRGLAAILLAPVALAYRALMALRRAGYAMGLLHTARAPVPVVVVGNLVVGGAGKTPTVIALVHALRARGWTPGVISRGYGSALRQARPVTAISSAADVGDEPLLIHRRTHAPVWVGRLRVDAARALCAASPEIDVIVADDGLQHLALARDAQLVVFDDRGAGNGMVLPAGPLREPLGAAVRPNTAVLYNAAQRTTHLPGSVVQRSLAGAVPLARWWRGEPAKPEGLAALAGHPLTAAAGIAAPQRFFAMLEAAGLTFKRMPLPDHHPLDPRPWTGQDGNVIVTEKDAVKLAPDAPDAHRIHVATLDFNLPAETVDALHGWLVARTQR